MHTPDQRPTIEDVISLLSKITSATKPRYQSDTQITKKKNRKRSQTKQHGDVEDMQASSQQQIFQAQAMQKEELGHVSQWSDGAIARAYPLGYRAQACKECRRARAKVCFSEFMLSKRSLISYAVRSA